MLPSHLTILRRQDNRLTTSQLASRLRSQLLPATCDGYGIIPNRAPDEPELPRVNIHYVAATVVQRSEGQHRLPSTWVLIGEPEKSVTIGSHLSFTIPDGTVTNIHGEVKTLRVVEKKWVEFTVDCGLQRGDIYLQVPRKWTRISLGQKMGFIWGILFSRYAHTSIPEPPTIVHFRQERVFFDDRAEGRRSFQRIVERVMRESYGK